MKSLDINVTLIICLDLNNATKRIIIILLAGLFTYWRATVSQPQDNYDFKSHFWLPEIKVTKFLVAEVLKTLFSLVLIFEGNNVTVTA